MNELAPVHVARFASGKRVGRPPRYSGDLIPIACALARAGFTDPEIAEELDVSTTTLTNWRNRFPEFVAALNQGKEKFDQRVERSLAYKALPRRVKRIKTHFDKDTNEWHAFEYEEEVEADTTSMIFWLKNRKPLEWRDRVDVSGKLETDVTHRLDDSGARVLALAVLNLLSDGVREHGHNQAATIEGDARDTAAPAEAGELAGPLRRAEGTGEGGAGAAESVEEPRRPAPRRNRR